MAEDPTPGAPPTGATAWLNILCGYNGQTSFPDDPSYFQTLLMGSGAPHLNDYWKEVSYNSINLSGSNTTPWYTMASNKNDLVAQPLTQATSGNPGGNQARLQVLLDQCIGAAEDDPNINPTLTQYYGFNLMFSDQALLTYTDPPGLTSGFGVHRNICFAYSGTDCVTSKDMGITWIGPTGTASYHEAHEVAHEMGHGYGPAHSHADIWDVMGDDTCYFNKSGQTYDPTYGCIPVHVNAYHKAQLNWLTGKEYDVSPNDLHKLVVVDRLALPPDQQSGHYLLVKIPIASTSSGDNPQVYTIEARYRYGNYDGNTNQGVHPDAAIVIHRVYTFAVNSVSGQKSTAGEDEFLCDHTGATCKANDDDPDTSAWNVKQTFSDPNNQVYITVVNDLSNGFRILLGQPEVTSVNPSYRPTSGKTMVTVQGADFVTDATVFNFGTNNPATSVTCTTDSSCNMASPAGSGTPDVTATVGAVTSPSNPPFDTFQYVPAPSISSVSPNSGPADGGTQVTITGQGFAPVVNATSFYFGPNNPAPAASVACNAQGTSCVATSPPGSGTVDVTAKVAGQFSVATSADQFTYIPPQVTGISPTHGPPGGPLQPAHTMVTISGSGFTGARAVWFGEEQAEDDQGNIGPGVAFTVVDDHTISASAPWASPGEQVHVQVITDHGYSTVSSVDIFTYDGSENYHGPQPRPAMPTITGISVTSGPANGGGTLVITGTNLVDVDDVRFGNANSAPSFSGSGTQLTVTIPPAPGGYPPLPVVADIIVITEAVFSSPLTANGAYTYYAGTPTVSGLSPSQGDPAGGTAVTITGTNFSATGLTVQFGAAQATNVHCQSNTRCTVTAPPGSGTVDVTVTVNGITSQTNAQDQFSYSNPPPIFTSVSPTVSGPGSTITITGDHFSTTPSQDQVTFNGRAATVTAATATQLTVTVPSGATSGPLSVTTPGAPSRRATSSCRLRATAPPAWSAPAA